MYYTLAQTCIEAGIDISVLVERISSGQIRLDWMGDLPRLNEEQHDRVVNSVYSQYL